MSLAGCSRAIKIPPTEIPTATPILLPTPFLPAETKATAPNGQTLPSPTPWVFPTPYWDNTTINWPYGIPTMAIPVEETFEGPVKVYVLLGSDWMPHRDHDLTDAVMLVLVNTETDSATVISIARDLYVFIPGFGWGRINQPWALGGFDTVKETIRYNFGLEVDGVVYARIYAVENFIDNGLGHLFVQVSEPIIERCGDLVIDLIPGEVFMDGEYAMCYARSRMMTSDFSRMVRQQEILSAMKKRFFERAMNHPVALGEDLYAAFVLSGIKTDIQILDVPGLVEIAVDVKDDIDFALIAPPLVEHFDHPESGAWLLQMPTPKKTYEFFIGLLDE